MAGKQPLNSGPDESNSKWLDVEGAGNLEEAVEEVASLILDAEKNWASDLADKIDLLAIQEIGGKHLAGCYSWLLANSSPDEQAGKYRDHWVEQCLRRFRHALRPPERSFSATGKFDQHVPYIRAVSSEGMPQTTTLRIDQMNSSRKWGVWFTFEESTDDKRAATSLFRSAISQLTSDLSGIHRLVSAYNKGGHKIEYFDLDPSNPGHLFETLIVDILNEKKPLAGHARLLEDLLEQTDIRVKYPNLNRKNGARVQVGLQSRAKIYKKKLDNLNLGTEFVRISPIELAHIALHHQGSDYLNEMDWIPFWKRVGEQEWDVEPLADRLKGLFFTAFRYSSTYPLGALEALPEQLRILIRLVVEHKAFDVTRNLRSRERIKGTFRPSSRDFGK